MVAEVWMLLCTMSIPHVEASISRVLATSMINKHHWGLSFTEHKRTLGRIKKGNLYLNHMKVINPCKKQELDCIGDPYALLLAGLVEGERVLRVEEENMQNFFYLQETLVFQQDRSFNSRERPAQTLDQFDPRYECAEFPVRIYYDTCAFQSADHYSGTYVDAEGSLFRRRSQSTCLEVEFRSWA